MYLYKEENGKWVKVFEEGFFATPHPKSCAVDLSTRNLPGEPTKPNVTLPVYVRQSPDYGYFGTFEVVSASGSVVCHSYVEEIARYLAAKINQGAI